MYSVAACLSTLDDYNLSGVRLEEKSQPTVTLTYLKWRFSTEDLEEFQALGALSKPLMYVFALLARPHLPAGSEILNPYHVCAAKMGPCTTATETHDTLIPFQSRSGLWCIYTIEHARGQITPVRHNSADAQAFQNTDQFLATHCKSFVLSEPVLVDAANDVDLVLLGKAVSILTHTLVPDEPAAAQSLHAAAKTLCKHLLQEATSSPRVENMLRHDASMRELANRLWSGYSLRDDVDAVQATAKETQEAESRAKFNKMTEQWKRDCAERMKRRKLDTPASTQEAPQPPPASALASPLPLLKRRRTSAADPPTPQSEKVLPAPAQDIAIPRSTKPSAGFRFNSGHPPGSFALVRSSPKLVWPFRRSKRHPKTPAQPKAFSTAPARREATVAEYLQHIYFERQREGRCGLHALNNIIGPMLTDEDMEFALTNFMDESVESAFETRDLHTRPGGWYSVEVLSNVLRTAFMAKFDRIVYELSLRVAKDNPDGIYAENCAGALVNVRGVHWTCVRYALGRLWYVDSLQEGPVPLTQTAWLRLLGKHPGTYYIQRV